MVEVIGKDDSQYKQTICRSCANMLRYVNSDVKQSYTTDHTGDRDYYNYITCPCGKEVNVRGY